MDYAYDYDYFAFVLHSLALKEEYKTNYMNYCVQQIVFYKYSDIPIQIKKQRLRHRISVQMCSSQSAVMLYVICLNISY